MRVLRRTKLTTSRRGPEFRGESGLFRLLWGHISINSNRRVPQVRWHYGGMRTILNLIWLFLGGIWLALAYFFVGLIMCLLIITIPFGIASFRMGVYALWPFGRAVIDKPGAGAGSAVGNVIWFLVAGIWLALTHVMTAFAQGITIIGLPVALANLKMIPIACFPFGKQIVPTESLPPNARPLHSF